MWAQGRTFGTAAYPFGKAVADPEEDLRLAAFALNTLDFETGMVFDVWMTNNAVYPCYERLNLTGTERGHAPLPIRLPMNILVTARSRLMLFIVPNGPVPLRTELHLVNDWRDGPGRYHLF